jgi:uncharacterized protein (DUF488 family)
MKPVLFTVGYQGRAIDEFVRLLLDQSVEVVIDVRLRPSSRRPGFSKTPLAASCAEAGIHYQHERDLGTPADILDAFRKTGIYHWDDYVTHLDSHPEVLNDAIELASDLSTCLVCFEADPMECHRRFVADRIARHLDLGRTDL